MYHHKSLKNFWCYLYWLTCNYFQNNFPLIETLLECGAKGSVGKTSDGSQVLHVQAEKADDLDLSDLYPDAHVVSDKEISSKLHTKTIVEFLKATCKRTQQLPTLLGQQGWELLRPFRQWCANGCNNSQQCWDLQCIVGWSRKSYGLYPCVMRVRGQQQCWKRCENGSNIVSLRFGDHGTKEILGRAFVGSNFWPVSNFAEQLQTTRSNIQQHSTLFACGRNI